MSRPPSHNEVRLLGGDVGVYSQRSAVTGVITQGFPLYRVLIGDPGSNMLYACDVISEKCDNIELPCKWLCVYVWVLGCVCICAGACVCVCGCVCICLGAWVCVYMGACVVAWVCVCAGACECLYAYVFEETKLIRNSKKYEKKCAGPAAMSATQIHQRPANAKIHMNTEYVDHCMVHYMETSSTSNRATSFQWPYCVFFVYLYCRCGHFGCALHLKAVVNQKRLYIPQERRVHLW